MKIGHKFHNTFIIPIHGISDPLWDTLDVHFVYIGSNKHMGIELPFGFTFQKECQQNYLFTILDDQGIIIAFVYQDYISLNHQAIALLERRHHKITEKSINGITIHHSDN